MTDEKEYSSEVSEAIGDGGGCTEAWEAISEIRNEVGRRNFLKGTGSSLLGVLGFSAVTSAKEVDRDVRKALDSEPVDTILRELDNPAVTENGAASYVQETTGTRVVEIPTLAGKLRYITRGDGAAFLRLDISSSQNRNIPKKYERFPGENGTLSTKGDEEVEFTRELTKTEQKRVATILGCDGSSLSASISTANSGDITVYQNRGGSEPDGMSIATYQLSWDQALTPFRPLPGGTPEIRENDEGQIGVTQSNTCQAICATCVTTLAYLCPSCFQGCYEAGDPATALLCISCVTAACGILLPASCVTCQACA